MSKVFKNIGKVNLRNPQDAAKVFGAVNAFLAAPTKVESMLAGKVHEFTPSGNFPAEAQQLIEKFSVSQEEIDLAYQASFDVKDLTNTRLANYTIREVTNLITFGKVKEGEKAKIYPISGAELAISFDAYGAGIELPEAWFQDQRWYDLEEAVVDYRLAWYRDKASVFYALMEALTDEAWGSNTGVNIAYDTAGSNQLEKDVNTINAACYSILNGLKATYKTTPDTPLVLTTNQSMHERCRKALNAQNISGYSGPTVDYNVSLYRTFALSTSDKWVKAGSSTAASNSQKALGYLTLAGKKNKVLNRMELTSYPPEFDTLAFARKIMAWGRYAGCVNYKQWRRLLSNT